MSSYLLTEAGEVAATEAGDRLCWETRGSAAILSGIAAAGAGARRLGVGQVAVAASSGAAVAGRRIAVGDVVIAGGSSTAPDAARITHGAALTSAVGIVSGLGQLFWDPALPSQQSWTEQSAGASPWAEQQETA